MASSSQSFQKEERIDFPLICYVTWSHLLLAYLAFKVWD